MIDSKTFDPNFKFLIALESGGENIKKCFSCGTCTAGCPVREVTDRYNPWYSDRFWAVPLLWVLHLGYGWLVAGYVLKALAAFGLIAPQFSIHAFTAGAIGVLTLGMMARVSLGHTGRPLTASVAMAIAFALINGAALLRGLAPAVYPQRLLEFVASSGALWAGAYLIFMAIYVPILTRPRIDGKPG